MSSYTDNDSSSIDRKVFIVGRKKYLHGIYTENIKSLPVDNDMNKRFAIRVHDNKTTLLTLLDNQQIMTYSFNAKESWLHNFEKEKIKYHIDFGSIKRVKDTARLPKHYTLIASGNWEYLGNKDIILLGTRDENVLFTYRFRTSHRKYAYSQVEITDKECPFTTSVDASHQNKKS